MSEIKRLSETWCPVCGVEGTWQYTDWFEDEPDEDTGGRPYYHIHQVYWCDQCQQSFLGNTVSGFHKPWEGQQFKVNK